MSNNFRYFHVTDKRYLTAWVMVTLCFVLWGFANSVTTPLVNTFPKIFLISNTEALQLPIVFYLGYLCIALPAAIIIQRKSYKWGVLLAMLMLAIGALLFIPSKMAGGYYPFLMAYFVLTCGLSFLEISCTPYIYTLGSKEHAIQRLNGAQAFNAVGVLLGMAVATKVLSLLHPMETHIRRALPLKQFYLIRDHDLNVLIQPYILIAVVTIILLVLMTQMRVPKDEDIRHSHGTLKILRQLFSQRNYREGVIAQCFYLGAQVCCWTYIIQYGMRIFISEGMTEQHAMVLAQKYNLLAIIFFAAGRFTCTWLLRWLNPSRMLSTLAVIGMVALMGAILFTDRNGLYCMVTVSACMSMMFPTIYGLALESVHAHVKIAAAGLAMAFLGGSLFPPLQALIIQSHISLLGLPSTNVSMVLPLLCMMVVIWYGHRTYVRFHIKPDDGSLATTTPEE